LIHFYKRLELASSQSRNDEFQTRFVADIP